MSVQPTAFPIGNARSPRPAGTAIALYRDSSPERPFEAVARLNVHVEKTFLIPTAFAEVLPKLETLARQYGANALMDIREKKSHLNETFIYNVSATAVVVAD